MVHEDTNARPASKRPCIYWSGTACTAVDTFPEADITCYHEGNCDGFGTCRGCSKYDQGGLKFGTSDGDGGDVQQPMNLQLYNIRAKVKPCCFWDAEPDNFIKTPLGLEPNHISPFDPPASGTLLDKETACTLEVARPWQTPFTDENPTAYGCNGAKSECPYYTGPKFTELVDSKMDTGDRITAKQVLELRFHSSAWGSYSDPREAYEKRFTNPDIWAWALESPTATDVEGALRKGRLDEFSQPMVQKVRIDSLTTDVPSFTVYAPESVSTGTPTIGQPPKFPDLISELDDASVGMEVIFPRGTTPNDAFVRKTFTQAEMVQWIAVQINSTNEVVAINLTKHPQGGNTDLDFVSKIKRAYPEDAILDFKTSLPGSTFPVPLVLDGKRETLNHIRIFLDYGAADGSMLTADVYVRHIFYHAEIAQTSFTDKYGHTQIDPWVDHFTDMRVEADFKHLTNNTTVHDVLWNTITSSGKKTVYAIENIEQVTSEANELLWEPIGCGAVLVTFTNPEINRVYPWRAWGSDTTGEGLYVRVDRSGNNKLPAGTAKEVTLELLFASTKGTYIPPNMAIFRIPPGEGTPPLDRDRDKLFARYAYTEYKQGPILPDDESLLKFPSDTTKVMEEFVYDVTFGQENMSVDGTFVKVGEHRIRSCEDVLGNCYTKKALENEGLATTVFFAGGLGESNVKTAGEMQKECREEFNAKYAGTLFPDETPVTLSEVINKLSGIYLLEGSQHYDVIFSDEDGRPIGIKRVGFLTQSAIVQTRDVEIKYKWGSHMQHYPTRGQFLIEASFHEPTFATRERLTQVIYENDPSCGDHQETTIGQTGFTAFNLSIDEHGALWYPYKQCLQPRYHVGYDEWWAPANYTDTVEGFYEEKRRYYWERMRWFDQYRPSIMNLWGQIGCFWSEYSTTANAIKPVIFTGYTKIRSDHAFGPYATDRESIRVSRHWEKRNIAATAEVITQEEGGLSIELTDEFKAVLYDEDGNLKEGASTATPIWMHINDDFSVVKPASEEILHPFGRYLLKNVGSYTYDELFIDERREISEVFVDRDYTSNAVRATDGTVIHLTEESFANNSEGEIENVAGKEVRWVFADNDSSWAWLAQPPPPKRDSVASSGEFISGLSLNNIGTTFFKKNKESATHPEEGNHIISYTPHEFNADGEVSSPATLSMDGGPEWNISQTDGLLYVLEGSPYLTEEHEGEDYSFALYGAGPGGVGVLADGRGLQFFEVAGTKKATYAGVNINLLFNIDELPYKVLDINRISRLTVGGDLSPAGLAQSFEKSYDIDDREVKKLELYFKGHYFVEEVKIDFELGGDVDVPAVQVSGFVKTEGVATISGTMSNPTVPEEVMFFSDTYISGKDREFPLPERKTISVRERVFNLDISFGARNTDRRMVISKIQVLLRDHVPRTETVYLYEPRVQLSTAKVGTHKPSDLEFYFQREVPDFAKNYESGSIALANLDPGVEYSVTKLPGVEVKWLGRQIKDLMPMFNFTNFEGVFPYDNIDISAIPGYVEGTSQANQTLRYIDSPVRTSSKGWTLSTSQHYSDPSASKVPTESGPDGIPNVQVETWPNEDLQKYLYNSAVSQLGTTAVYTNFWHPDEVAFFETAGVYLPSYSWELTLRSSAAPLDRVFRSENYGCQLQVTNENLDGIVHRLPIWQAKGVFHYLCDPRYSWACFSVVMNKCEEYLFSSYGTPSYLDNNVVDRFSYKFEFPPKDRMAYISRGLFNQNEQGGYIGGTGGIGIAQISAPYPPLDQVRQQYQSDLSIAGKDKYQ